VLKKVNHIGIVVRDADTALKPFVEGLRMTPGHSEVLDGPGVKIAFLPVGDVELELVEPRRESGMAAEFLAETGGGIHHVCFEVDDIDEAIAYLKARNYQLIDQEPRPGNRGSRIAFLRPEQFGGVYIELCQSAKG
jgi:methylmalonyl-CoA/ethylmalonyl-CoA epimerase